MDTNDKKVKIACYTANLSMAIVGNLSPLLFLTFHSMYDISYSFLGLLILINFSTQLAVDLMFSFFSHKFNIEMAVKIIPVITSIGFLVYSIFPLLFPKFPYLGIALGTFIFSSSGGLSEVLISPVIAAIPSEDPDKEMSRLHSVYAWGSVFVIIFGTVFLSVFGKDKWYFLTFLLLVIPIFSAILFADVKIPKMETPEKTTDVFSYMKNKYLWLSVIAIFLGGAAECTMAQWSSGYLEEVFGISKIYGDLFGVAFFSIMLGIGRTMYSKIGKNIEKVILSGSVGAAVCYFIVVISDVPVVGLLACAATGFCVSMLWPGNLIIVSKRFPSGGVFVFAMMAAGGDLGAAVVPQLVGLVADSVIGSPYLSDFAEVLCLTPEQLGLKAGIFIAMLFPFFAIFICLLIVKTKNKPVFYCVNRA